MKITIDIASNPTAMCMAAHIREEVFGERYSHRVPSLDAYAPSKILTIIAKEAATNAPAATLSVVDTCGESKLHGGVGLTLPEGTRVARYTQMAVLKPYRGLHLPSRLITEARLRFVVPRKITHSWLLYRAETAHTSFLCMNMGFTASTHEIMTEYGLMRLLVRNESALAGDPSARDLATANAYLWPRAVTGNKWLAL